MFVKTRTKIYSSSKIIKIYTTPILFLFVFLLVFLNKIDSFFISKIKTNSIDFITPITQVLTYPVNKTNELFNKAHSIKLQSQEIEKLKEEIKRLYLWQQYAVLLNYENEAYKKLLNVEDDNLELKHTVKIISKSSNIYMNTVQLNAGKKKLIKLNSAVINHRGLVGRIIDIGNNTSRALLITDINSNIPAKIFHSEIKTIVSGTSNNKFLKLKFVKENAKPQIGQMLVTSGNTGVFPPNIPIGKIFKFEEDVYYLKPFVNFSDIDFVQIVDKKNKEDE